MENVITLGNLIGLLFCLPSSIVENSKNTRNELARPVMGTIFLVYCATIAHILTSNRVVNSGGSRIYKRGGA